MFIVKHSQGDSHPTLDQHTAPQEPLGGTLTLDLGAFVLYVGGVTVPPCLDWVRIQD